MFVCLECEESFDSENGLHKHIKKHDMFLCDYFVKHFARRNLLTGDLLPFKNKENYFADDFETTKQLHVWCDTFKAEVVKNYILDKLDSRIKEKELKKAPCEVELFSSMLPKIDTYKRHYGSYTAVCDILGVPPTYSAPLPKEFFQDFSDKTIIVDTREQEPIKFEHEEISKLDVGDYAIIDGFDYTYVDRKSEQDFKGTLVGKNYERFRRELLRCRSIGCYLFVVVECDMEGMAVRNKQAAHVSNLSYVFHNMREIIHDFSDCCQFVFSGSRKNSKLLIPKILHLGKKLWNVDLQYFINKEIL
jgi:hypothetical protein